MRAHGFDGGSHLEVIGQQIEDPAHLQRLLAQPDVWHSALLSLWIGAASTLASLLLTAALAGCGNKEEPKPAAAPTAAPAAAPTITVRIAPLP